MCGRYNLITDGQGLMDFFEVLESVIDLSTISARYNIAPSQSVPVIRQGASRRQLTRMRWGLVPFWSKEPRTRYRTINAKAETLATANSYREPFKRSRCLVPASGFYEWRKIDDHKQPYRLGLKDAPMLAFAGVWDTWKGETEDDTLESFSIITTSSNTAIKPIHDRMPVILGREDWRLWLEAGGENTARLEPLLKPCSSSLMELWPISTAVNKPVNDSPELVARQSHWIN